MASRSKLSEELYGKKELIKVLPEYIRKHASERDAEGRWIVPPAVWLRACQTCSPGNPGWSSDAGWFRLVKQEATDGE